MIRAVLCAQYYAGLKRTDHSCPYKNGTGENLWASWEGTSSFEDLARSASDAWYSESEDYNFYSEDFQPEKQNFSQMVWQSSQEFGFGLARNGNWTAGCALYSPSGNVNGAFLENVFSAYVPVQPPRTTHDINLIIKTASLRNMFKTQNSKQNPPIDNKPPVVITQHKVVSLEYEITSISSSHQVDIRKLLYQLVAIANRVENISHLVEENREAIDALTATVTELDDELDQAIDQINHLNSMNQLWKQNFQIVNRTFTVLKNSGCLGSIVFHPFNVLHKLVPKTS
ncbi:unnamed protein product [Orchesella dallaii]|uniref:SCP domain-containing protein n=1 Tax=Orchesella dallaii TaxID=48710 RepID=A0ABP1PV84_9HEXA